jgi:hypothetical protein
MAKSVFFSLLIISPFFAFAASGTIDPASTYAWSDNGGWVNWNPANGNVTVSDAGLSGYIWNANFGWINLSPTYGGVTNDGHGVLGGFAWGQDTGWVDFTGVTIDASGVFHGHTVAQSIFGTMTFDCTNCSVRTTWRAGTASGGTTPAGAGGGNGPPLSGPLSFGYNAPSTPMPTGQSASSTATPPSLTPKTPPPSIQPTTRPSSIGAQAAPLAADVSLMISADQSATVGDPISLYVRIDSKSPRTKTAALAYRLYTNAGTIVHSSSRTLLADDPSEFVEDIPTVNLTPATYTISVTAQYGTRKPTTQTLHVALIAQPLAPAPTISPKAQEQSTAPTSPAETKQQCTWFGACVWQSIIEFFARVFTR